MTAAVQAGLTPQRGQSDLSSFRLIGVCRELRCTHSTYMFNEACLGSLMRFGLIGFRPLDLVPFSSFTPSHTSVLLFSFTSFCLHVFHLILSFVCVHIGPGLSVYAHNYMYFRLRLYVAQVFIMRWVSLFVPVRLVPLSSQPHAPLPRPVLLSCLHSFVSCARARAHLPNLSFTPPLGEARVCVCVCPL